MLGEIPFAAKGFWDCLLFFLPCGNTLSFPSWNEKRSWAVRGRRRNISVLTKKQEESHKAVAKPLWRIKEVCNWCVQSTGNDAEKKRELRAVVGQLVCSPRNSGNLSTASHSSFFKSYLSHLFQLQGLHSARFDTQFELQVVWKLLSRADSWWGELNTAKNQFVCFHMHLHCEFAPHNARGGRGKWTLVSSFPVSKSRQKKVTSTINQWTGI